MSQDWFDKFTVRARRVLTLAQEEATRFNHNYIGTEHLLLGLVREGDGVAAKVLAELGVELDRVRNAVEYVIGRRDQVVRGEIGLTPRAKKVIELAVDEARRLGHHYIGTEHLLLGLVREGEGIAAGVLESLGVNLDNLRAETLRILGSQGTPPLDRVDAAEAVDAPIPAPWTWDYLDLQVGYPNRDGSGVLKYINGRESERFGKNKTAMAQVLAALGAQGWDLVAIDNPNGHNTNDPHYILKRVRLASVQPWLTAAAEEIAKYLPQPLPRRRTPNAYRGRYRRSRR